MTELENNLTKILSEKSTKIIPENIKKGITIFDITGTAETTSSGTAYNSEQNLANGRQISASFTGMFRITPLSLNAYPNRDSISVADYVVADSTSGLGGTVTLSKDTNSLVLAFNGVGFGSSPYFIQIQYKFADMPSTKTITYYNDEIMSLYGYSITGYTDAGWYDTTITASMMGETYSLSKLSEIEVDSLSCIINKYLSCTGDTKLNDTTFTYYENKQKMLTAINNFIKIEVTDTTE